MPQIRKYGQHNLFLTYDLKVQLTALQHSY